MIDRLERAPLAVKLLPAFLGLAIIALLLGGPVASVVITATIILLMALAGRGALVNSLKRRGKDRIDDGSLHVRIYEVSVSGSRGEDIAKLARLVSERASEGRADYVVLSHASSWGRKSVVMIVGSSREDVDVESEVFKTLVSVSSSSIRLRLIEGVAGVNAILDLLSRARARGDVVVLGGDMGPQASSEPPTSRRLKLGYRIDTITPKPVYLLMEDISGHVGVFGSTGSGKSTTLSVIISRSWRDLGIPVLVLDWTGEFSRMLGGGDARILDPLSEGGINPLMIRSMTEVVDVISKALDLTQPQEYLLMRVIEGSSPKSLAELVDYLDSMDEESRWDREVKRGLVRRIGVLISNEHYRAFSAPSMPPIDYRGVTIIDVSRIRSTMARRAYCLFYLAYLFVERSYREVNSHLLVVIDEAHNVFREESHFTGQLIAESRKHGLYIALATQSPSSIDNSILLNTNTKIIHSTKSYRDLEVIKNSIGLDQDVAGLISRLERGEALLQSPSNPEPVLVKVSIHD